MNDKDKQALEKYWNSLSPELQQAFHAALNRADELGFGDDIEIWIPSDIWDLLPKDKRGPKPS